MISALIIYGLLPILVMLAAVWIKITDRLGDTTAELAACALVCFSIMMAIVTY